MLPAIRHLSDGRRHRGLLTVWDGDALLATLVVAGLRLPAEGSRRFAVPAMQAWTEPYFQLSTPLIDRDRVRDALTALVRLPSPWRVPAPLAMRYFSDDGVVSRTLDDVLAAEGRRVVRLKTYERAAITRDSLANLTRNQRNRHRQLRKLNSVMAETLGHAGIEDRADDPAAVEAFLRLEGAGWKGQAGTALASRPEHAAWFREMCTRFREAGRLEVLTLTTRDGIAAMQCNVRAGDVAFHYKSAYDEGLREHRPGMQLLLANLDSVAEGRVTAMDSLTVADNALFNQVWPGRRVLSTVVLPPPGPAGALVETAARWAMTARARRSSKAARPQRTPGGAVVGGT